ncbi:hypothetical protein I553_4786 [Mycobacterium xenopi 4042]|uniref:Uncharacterized protein n=1 Tax=Mycobacterium xenopi 4042 TaxID=1299334 RepID=X8AG34_MYCXE|nr:hypothetical protein I553_4786 [Mycobacterium xenopi 4042]
MRPARPGSGWPERWGCRHLLRGGRAFEAGSPGWGSGEN